MGFLDKLKSIKNAVTGGAAEVFMECEPISFDQPFTVTIYATAGDAPVKVSRVYLYIRGREEVEVPDVDVRYDDDNNSHRRSEIVRASDTTVNLDITVADELVIEPNQTVQWQAEIEMPSHAPPCYKGKYCQHSYQAYAGLDCFGNDPDSGWIPLLDEHSAGSEAEAE